MFLSRSALVVQVRLIPPTAPFLKRAADLLVTAGCVPVAFPSLHRGYLEGKTVMPGCPKFDDAQGTSISLPRYSIRRG